MREPILATTALFFAKQKSSFLSTGSFFQTLGKFDQNASQKESVFTRVIGVFFGILLLQQYNQTRYFSLPYAMLIAIFMILGAIGLFMGLTFHVIAGLRAINGG
jgi:hypothetical protein